MDSEPAIERCYADLTMIIRPDKRHYKIFDVLIEFKLLSLKTLNLTGERLRTMSQQDIHDLPLVKQTLNNAKEQVLNYGNRLAGKYPGLRLKSFVVVALGFERVCFLDMGDTQNQ
jgi:hypothetical protein